MSGVKSREGSRLIAAGVLIGLISVVLVMLGNPKNMGFCIACFVRDTAGAVGLHQAAAVQYIRPEVIGLVLGAFVVSGLSKEFKPRGGSAPMLRLALGFLVSIGALVFLGCPVRMILRLAGGDLNAVVGLAGFVGGILLGVVFLNKGYNLKRTYTLPALEGAGLPIVQVILLALLVASPAFIAFSESGPGSMHAPLLISLAAGLIVGAVAQRTRLCIAGGIRDVLLFKDWTLLKGFLAILAAALVGNLVLNATVGGYFQLGFLPQPVAHSDGVWNFLGMTMVGFGSVLLGGCPMRQMVLAGEGNSDSAVTVVGLLLGAACAHNFGLASGAHSVVDGVLTGGPTMGGKVAVVLGLVVMLGIAAVNTPKTVPASRKEVNA